MLATPTLRTPCACLSQFCDPFGNAPARTKRAGPPARSRTQASHPRGRRSTLLGRRHGSWTFSPRDGARPQSRDRGGAARRGERRHAACSRRRARQDRTASTERRDAPRAVARARRSRLDRERAQSDPLHRASPARPARAPAAVAAARPVVARPLRKLRHGVASRGAPAHRRDAARTLRGPISGARAADEEPRRRAFVANGGVPAPRAYPRRVRAEARRPPRRRHGDGSERGRDRPRLARALAAGRHERAAHQLRARGTGGMEAHPGRARGGARRHRPRVPGAHGPRRPQDPDRSHRRRRSRRDVEDRPRRTRQGRRPGARRPATGRPCGGAVGRAGSPARGRMVRNASQRRRAALQRRPRQTAALHDPAGRVRRGGRRGAPPRLRRRADALYAP